MGLIAGQKKAFRNNLHRFADQDFFNLLAFKASKRYKKQLISIQARGELITGCIFFFRPFNWGVGLITVRGLKSRRLRSAKPTRDY